MMTATSTRKLLMQKFAPSPCKLMVAALAAILTAAAHAGESQEKPLWEIGVGVSALSFPAYRGAATQNNFLMPMPYFVYRGEFLKSDRYGLRGDIFTTDRLDLTVSASASAPTRSDDVPIREGMPELKPTVEFGPELDVTLWRSPERNRMLRLRLPLRAAFTVENSPRSAGFIFSPNLNADFSDLPHLPGWNLGLVAGPYFATRRQHEYFYSVPDQYATAQRSAYRAKGGYSGSMALISLSKRYDKTWVGLFVRYDTLAGAAFEDSPLTQRKHGVAGGIGVAWILGQSSTRVKADD
jgi:outer membrane scaffolding protein for murein synthesis (MipA/OmpV family)